MFCESCGKKLTSGIKFCSGCGQKVEVADEKQESLEQSENDVKKEDTVAEAKKEGNENHKNTSKYSDNAIFIRNWKWIMTCFLFSLALVLWGISELEGNSTMGFFLIVGGILFFIKFWAEKGGTVIDPGNNKIYFVSNLFFRKTVSISDITSIREWSTKKVDKGNVAYLYYLNIVGTFGSAKIAFAGSMEKRDQVASLIAQFGNLK